MLVCLRLYAYGVPMHTMLAGGFRLPLDAGCK